jgi:hypothetical protein
MSLWVHSLVVRMKPEAMYVSGVESEFVYPVLYSLPILDSHFRHHTLHLHSHQLQARRSDPHYQQTSTDRIKLFHTPRSSIILERDPENQAVIDCWTSYAHFHGIVTTVGGFFISDEFRAKNVPRDVVVGQTLPLRTRTLGRG